MAPEKIVLCVYVALKTGIKRRKCADALLDLHVLKQKQKPKNKHTMIPVSFTLNAEQQGRVQWREI